MFNLSVSQPTLHISFLCEDIAKGSKTEVEEINEAEDSDEWIEKVRGNWVELSFYF